MPIQPIYLKIGPNWQCCLAGSSKTAPRVLIFSIAIGADYSFYAKPFVTFALTFFGYIISVLASVIFLPGWSGAEIEGTVHVVAQPKRPIN